MKRLLHFLIAAAALVCGVLNSDRGYAINIVLVWDDLDENPDFDPDGTKLMAVANAAAQIWEPLIPSSGTHHVDVSWSYLDDTARGLWKLDPFGNNNIYFDTDTDWFVDPTPLVNEEFDFGDPFAFSSGKGSFLYATTTDADDWFDRTTPPGTLEIGYVGLPKTKAPPAAINNADLLSVILHELGHDLGVGGDELSGRYPIYPAHISGLRDVEVIESNKPDSEGYAEEHGHMAPIMALMSQTVGTGKRTLPSALDVIVAARDSNYLSVDLARKFVGIGTNWNSTSTWIGGRLPDGTDDAYAVQNGTVTLSNTGRAENLYIGRNSIVATAANDLIVDSLLRLEGGADVLRVNWGGSVTTGTIQAPQYSTIEMSGGALNVTSGGSIRGDLTGRGAVNFDGQVVVSGVAEASGGALAFTGNGSIKLLHIAGELGTGSLNAQTGDVKLGLGFAAGSNGAINVSPGHSLVITRDVAIPQSVEVGLDGMLTSEGADTDVTIGHLNVGINSTAQVLSRTLTLNDYGFVESAGHLTLASPVRTTLQGGFSIYGPGALKQDGDITVTGGVVNLAVNTLDWGNSTPTKANDLTLHPNSTLEVNSAVIGTYRGTLTVDSAILDVGAPWQLGSETATTAGGSLALIKSGATTPTVRGDGPLTAQHWIVTSGGDAFIESDLTVMPTASVIVFGGSKLFLAGNTTMRGGSYTGLGRLVQRGDIDVTDDTTIDTETFSWGNSLGLDFNTLTVHVGDTLTVNSTSAGDADNQFRGALRLDGGTLAVNTDSGWILPAQQLFLIGGFLELKGGIAAPHIQGQPLTVAGRITVTGGPAHLDSDVVFQSTHQTDIAAGATLHLNGATSFSGGAFTGPGTLQHNGTALLGSNNPLTATRFVQNGQLTVINPSNNATIQAPVIDFQPASKTKLFLDLHLRGQAVIRPGATFEGNGTLVVDANGSFTGGGNLGVDLENQGTVRPGFSPGTLNVLGDYTQGPSGALDIDLMGTTPGTWDVLAASGVVSLDGTLNVFLLGNFAPTLGDEFSIVTARGGLTGTFSDLVLPPLPAGQTWTIDYDATSVVLSTTTGGLPGDIDGDLKVDRKDAALFATYLGSGATTLGDLHTLQSNLGQGVRGQVAPANAVPEPASWVLAALALVCAVRCTRNRSALP